jgi:hypothetical protein
VAAAVILAARGLDVLTEADTGALDPQLARTIRDTSRRR